MIFQLHISTKHVRTLFILISFNISLSPSQAKLNQVGNFLIILKHYVVKACLDQSYKTFYGRNLRPQKFYRIGPWYFFTHTLSP
jgi:hypothetical protein